MVEVSIVTTKSTGTYSAEIIDLGSREFDAIPREGEYIEIEGDDELYEVGMVKHTPSGIVVSINDVRTREGEMKYDM